MQNFQGYLCNPVELENRALCRWFASVYTETTGWGNSDAQINLAMAIQLPTLSVELFMSLENLLLFFCVCCLKYAMLTPANASLDTGLHLSSKTKNTIFPVVARKV